MKGVVKYFECDMLAQEHQRRKMKEHISSIHTKRKRYSFSEHINEYHRQRVQLSRSFQARRNKQQSVLFNDNLRMLSKLNSTTSSVPRSIAPPVLKLAATAKVRADPSPKPQARSSISNVRLERQYKRHASIRNRISRFTQRQNRPMLKLEMLYKVPKDSFRRKRDSVEKPKAVAPLSVEAEMMSQITKMMQENQVKPKVQEKIDEQVQCLFATQLS